MKAVVKTEPLAGQAVYLDWPEPGLGPRDVLIAVKRAGLCGTDLHLYDWDDTAQHAFKAPLPMVMGHEFCGEVVEVGREIVGVQPGDQVAVDPSLTCGACRFCRSARSVLCPERKLLGMHLPGAFAEYIAVPGGNVYPLPERVPWDLAAVAEPFTVALHALERMPIEPGDTVCIIGPGGVGFCLLAALKLTPVARILMIGLESDRRQLDLAASLGATTIVADREDPLEVVRSLTGGLGADVCFEAAGHPRAVELAIQVVRRAGRVGLLGLPQGSANLSTAAIVFAELDLLAIRAYDPRTWRRTPTLLARAAPDLAHLVTHRIPLSDVHRAVELTRTRQGIKVVLTADVGDSK